MEKFNSPIYLWYDAFKRDLPWRNTRNPYKIWISEIILQQTRIAQGTAYYSKFIDELGDVSTLASAKEEKVLKLWQGLGYYSRARNLHYAAKTIVSKHNGRFPNNYNSIRALKGVGDYTAAAVASIAFNLPYAVVDGNIYRVLSRYFGINTAIDTGKGKKEFQMLANDLLDKEKPGFHNQALMEFGALQCVPKTPHCHLCPIMDSCYAHQNGLVSQLPVKANKNKQRVRYFYYFYIEHNGHVFLEKRSGDDIWKNLYQLPLIESTHELKDAEILHPQFSPSFYDSAIFQSLSPVVRHTLSHQILHTRFIHLKHTRKVNLKSPIIRVKRKDIYKFAVPRLVEQYLQNQLGND